MKRITHKDLASMSEEEILDLKLCELDLHWQDSSFAPLIQEALASLKRRGLRCEPGFWISTEWFCPDGSVGVAIPFFLLHPKLLKLERQYMGDVDGGSPSSFCRVLRHELGHAMDNAYGFRSDLQRTQIFGSPKKKYPHHYTYKLYSTAFVSNIGNAYAQSHPDEDFAETFAVWLQPKKEWMKRYNKTTALQKLIYLDHLMTSVKGKTPPRQRYTPIDALNEQRLTLRDYYRRKQKYYKLDKFKLYDVGLRRFLKAAPEGTQRPLLQAPPKNLIHPWRQAVARALNIPLYRVDPILRGVLLRSQALGRVFSLRRPNTETLWLDFVIGQTKIYLQKGLDRVIL